MSNEFVMVPLELAEVAARALSSNGYDLQARDLEAALVQRHQGEPVALPERKLHVHQGLSHTDAKADGWNACLDEIAKLGPLYTHSDPSDIRVTRQALESLKGEANDLRAHLAEWDALLQEIRGQSGSSWLRGETQHKLDAALSASAELSAPVELGPWLPLSAPGQIQEGDWLCFTVSGSFICAQARLIIYPGTDKEEIVYNRKKNHYFCTDMAISGTSNHKGVLVARAALERKP